VSPVTSSRWLHDGCQRLPYRVQGRRCEGVNVVVVGGRPRSRGQLVGVRGESSFYVANVIQPGAVTWANRPETCSDLRKQLSVGARGLPLLSAVSRTSRGLTAD